MLFPFGLPDMKEADQILLDLEQRLYRADAENEIDKWVETMEEMIVTSPETLDGIRAKARVACSGRLGDLEDVFFDPSAPHNDQTLENSILRDLIRLYDPHLEHRGAVAFSALVVQLPATSAMRLCWVGSMTCRMI
jgi:hypothetical protein